jgi:hypothetical protein
MPAVGRASLVAFDCPNPRELAEFYAALTGWSVELDEHADLWVQLRSDGGMTLAFQRADDWRPPQWPGVSTQRRT